MSDPEHPDRAPQARTWEPVLSVRHRRHRGRRQKPTSARISSTLGWLALLLLVVIMVVLGWELTSERPPGMSHDEYRLLGSPFRKK